MLVNPDQALERPGEAPGLVSVPEVPQTSPAPLETAARPSAGVSGAGLEPATRIGQRNAEIQERNRAVQAARAALDVARRALDGLERAAAAGQRWVSRLARGLGVQIAGEREERARQAELAAERERQAQEAVRQERARLTEAAVQGQAQWTAQAGQVLPPGPAITQEQRDAARRAGVWDRVEDAGRKAREADRARQGPDHERPGERQGPRM